LDDPLNGIDVGSMGDHVSYGMDWQAGLQRDEQENRYTYFDLPQRMVGPLSSSLFNSAFSDAVMLKHALSMKQE
jgi:hypothetical protein